MNSNRQRVLRVVSSSSVGNIRLIRNKEHWGAGDEVSTPDGVGVVDDKITEGSVDGMEASEDNPVYAVVVEDEGVGVGFYRGDELSEGSIPDTEFSPEDLGGRESEGNVANQDGFFEWPPSWKKSEKPARLIALDVWTSMGAQHSPPPPGDSCTGTMRGEVVSPDRFCADFKDRLYGTEKWRGGWVD